MLGWGDDGSASRRRGLWKGLEWGRWWEYEMWVMGGARMGVQIRDVGDGRARVGDDGSEQDIIGNFQDRRARVNYRYLVIQHILDCLYLHYLLCNLYTF